MHWAVPRPWVGAARWVWALYDTATSVAVLLVMLLTQTLRWGRGAWPQSGSVCLMNLLGPARFALGSGQQKTA